MFWFVLFFGLVVWGFDWMIFANLVGIDVVVWIVGCGGWFEFLLFVCIIRWFF